MGRIGKMKRLLIEEANKRILNEQNYEDDYDVFDKDGLQWDLKDDLINKQGYHTPNKVTKEIYGCTKRKSINYNPKATIDDGSCEIRGCMDKNALNYDPNATIDCGKICCKYPVPGCTDPNAINWDSRANVDDGSCEYEKDNIMFEWITDYDKGIKKSKETNLPAMLFFTGSGWCSWCKQLINKVFSKEKFKNWAKETIVAIELDSPREDRNRYEYLQEKYNTYELPTCIFLDSRGNRIGHISGFKEESAWITLANEILNKQ